MNGKAPQMPQPIAPKKKFLRNSFLITCQFSNTFFRKKGARSKNTLNHLQKASEIGGTCSTPPLAMIKFVAMKIGCTNNNM